MSIREKGKLYPVASLLGSVFFPSKVMVETIGEFRPPKKGEYYISGAMPKGHKALGDMGMCYVIERLVEVKARTVIDVIGPITEDEIYNRRRESGR